MSYTHLMTTIRGGSTGAGKSLSTFALALLVWLAGACAPSPERVEIVETAALSPVEVLIADLESPDRKVRARAALKLGDMGAPAAVDPLTKLAARHYPPPEDGYVEIPGGSVKIEKDRLAALYALGRIGGEKAFRFLADLYLAEQDSHNLLGTLASNLADADPRKAEELFRRDLESPNPKRRSAAVIGYRNLDSGKEYEKISSMRDDPNSYIRKNVATYLKTRPFSETKDDVLSMLYSDDVRRNVLAMEIIESRIYYPFADLSIMTPELTNQLVEKLQCEKPASVCLKAAKVLGRYGKYDAMKPTLLAYLTGGVEELERFACQILGRGLFQGKIKPDFVDDSLRWALLEILEGGDRGFCLLVEAANVLVRAGWTPPFLDNPESLTVESVSEDYYIHILLGREESLPLLLEALEEFGTWEMYKIFRGSGHIDLKYDAEDWRERNLENLPSLRVRGDPGCSATWSSAPKGR